MNRNIICLRWAAVAVAAAFGQAAWAQGSNVQLYGRANVGLDNYEAKGAAVGSSGDLKARMRVFDSLSRVGLRGSEDLGNGLRAIFQIETGVNIDNGSNTGQDGAVNGNTGLWASRDSYVGLQSNYGRLTFGRQSIYWTNGSIIQHSANYVNTDVPFFSGVNTGRMRIFISRNPNTVQYTSPTFAGFNTTLSWSPTTGAGGGFVNNETRQGGQQTDANLWGATVRWSGGPFAAQVDYATKKTASDAVPHIRPQSSGLKALAGWRYMPGAQISVIYLQLRANDLGENSAGFANEGDDLKQSGWGISWEHTLGNVQLLAQYGQLGDVKGCSVVNGCSNTGTQAYMAGARYNLSKRTAVYATYNQVRNESNALQDYYGQALNGPGLQPGADPRIIALGIMHNF